MVVGAGAVHLAVDIPVAQTTATITLGGQPLPATTEYGSTSDLYLVAKDTGEWHLFASFEYAGSTSSPTLFGPNVDPRVVPGTYDVLYCHNCSTQGNVVPVYDETDATDAFPDRPRACSRSNVTVPAGTTNLTVDIPVTHTTSTITLGGKPLPSTDEYGAQIEIYLVSHDTGQWQTFATFSYNSSLFGPTVDPLVGPGIYDVYYCHDCTTPASGGIAQETDATDSFPRGLRVLQTGVTLAAGSANLNIDVPVTAVSETVTLAGHALPATNEYGSQMEIYLVARATPGEWHTLAHVQLQLEPLTGPSSRRASSRASTTSTTATTAAPPRAAASRRRPTPPTPSRAACARSTCASRCLENGAEDDAELLHAPSPPGPSPIKGEGGHPSIVSPSPSWERRLGG